MDIHRSSIRDYVMPKVKSVFVIDYYEGIRGLLASRDEFPYTDFLANPKLRTNKEIVWSTDLFDGQPVLLCDLDSKEKSLYSNELKHRIEAIELIVSNLRVEGDEALSELLSKAISYIDERSVYCGDGNIVVVNWGLMPRRPDLGSGSIYRSGKFVGNWGKFQSESQVLEKPSIKEEPMGNGLTENVDPGISVPPISIQSPLTEEISVVEQEIAIMNTPKEIVQPVPFQVETPPSVSQTYKVENPTPTEKEEEKTENIEKSEEPEKDKNNPDNKDTGKKAKETKKEDEYNWKSFFTGLWQGLKFFIRKIWWFLLMLLLLFVILFFSKGCQGPISQINPFYNPLPETPRILPIESGAVGMSADGMTQIATDRLNIVLEKENENTMLEWAKAFKKEYSGEDYEIFYYNEEFYNLQIKVPSAEREQIKKEIKQKLSGFSFDVFDELVFNSDEVQLNDPELQNKDHSWYLDAIGVKDAWNYTLGDPEIVVAIVDNGFDLTHPELKGKIVRPYNVLTNDTKIRPIVTSEGENGHGTHVAATAVGNANNGTGLLGIAPNCKLMPIQVGNDNPLGNISNQAIMSGVLYAIEQGADVVNVSLGMYVSQNVKKMSEGEQLNYISSTMKYEEALWDRIFLKAKNRNSIIVFSAGNDNVVAGIDPKKRNKETIRVSAVGLDLRKTIFSNYGRYEHLNREYSSISAPGVGIFSAYPHCLYKSLNGTSMAAPIVTGAVALIKSIDRNISSNQALSILQSTGIERSAEIGPIINVGRAVRKLLGKERGSVDCDEIGHQIRKLQAQIDSLLEICPDAGISADTLKYKDAVKGKHGLDGLWKTTTELVVKEDNTLLELLMQFRGTSGKLIIINKGKQFTAKLKAKVGKDKITITQKDDARNATSNVSFNKYTYYCTSDRKGNLLCTAYNSVNRITFNLIKVK